MVYGEYVFILCWLCAITILFYFFQPGMMDVDDGNSLNLSNIFVNMKWYAGNKRYIFNIMIFFSRCCLNVLKELKASEIMYIQNQIFLTSRWQSFKLWLYLLFSIDFAARTLYIQYKLQTSALSIRIVSKPNYKQLIESFGSERLSENRTYVLNRNYTLK